MEWALQLALSKAGILIGAFIGLLALEKIFPAVKLRVQFPRMLKNFSLAGLNIVLSPFIVVPITLLAAQFQLSWRPQWFTGIIFDLILLDCWIYFWHRANHAIPLLWRFHEVHHLDEALDVSSALRFHFGEVILSSLMRAMIILLLAVPITSVIIFEVLVTVAAMFHHSNIRLPQWLEVPLSYVIVTPSIHFLHHHALREDTDSNYATGFSVWDRIFGSRNGNARTQGMVMGIEGQGDVSLPRLIFRPFWFK